LVTTNVGVADVLVVEVVPPAAAKRTPPLAVHMKVYPEVKLTLAVMLNVLGFVELKVIGFNVTVGHTTGHPIPIIVPEQQLMSP
jgi:hypothetical protein